MESKECHRNIKGLIVKSLEVYSNDWWDDASVMRGGLADWMMSGDKIETRLCAVWLINQPSGAWTKYCGGNKEHIQAPGAHSIADDCSGSPATFGLGYTGPRGISAPLCEIPAPRMWEPTRRQPVFINGHIHLIQKQKKPGKSMEAPSWHQGMSILPKSGGKPWKAKRGDESPSRGLSPNIKSESIQKPNRIADLKTKKLSIMELNVLIHLPVRKKVLGIRCCWQANIMKIKEKLK